MVLPTAQTVSSFPLDFQKYDDPSPSYIWLLSSIHVHTKIAQMFIFLHHPKQARPHTPGSPPGIANKIMPKMGPLPFLHSQSPETRLTSFST